jgi:TolA-binding protein
VNPKEPLGPWLDPGLDSARIARQWAGIEGRLDGRARPRWTWATWGAALAGATIAVSALGVGISHWRGAPEPVAVAPSGSSVLALADGSRVTLEGGAKLDVPTNEPGHVVAILKSGTARFDVAPAPDRVFTLVAGEVEMSVAGTQFQVDLDAASGVVTVAVSGGEAEVHRASQPGEVHHLGVGETWSTTSAPDVKAPPAAPSADVPAATAASPEPSAPAPTPSTHAAIAPTDDARSLFESANQARRAGDLARASNLYRELTRRYPNDPRARVAALELGRIEMDRDPAGAEHALRQASGAEAGSSVHEDALARLVQLYAAKGDTRACQDARARYLTAYPTGVHGAQVRAACASR